MVFFSSALFAQSPQELLYETANNYRKLDSVEMSGHLTSVMPGANWRVRCDAVSASAGPKFVPPESPWPSFDNARQFGKCGYVKVRNHRESVRSAGASDKPPNAGWTMPSSWGDYRTVDKAVKSARLLASQTLVIGGERITCKVVEVTFEPASGAAPKTVQYWIDPMKHVVLQQKFAEANFAQHGTIYQWTFTVDSLTLNQPPSKWLVDSYEGDVGKTRPEWVGRAAPDFTLRDLAGESTTLSALYGKAVLLDFWGTYCGPCKEEMPSVERLQEEYRDKGLEVWGVTDDSEDKAQKFLRDNHRALPTLIDQGRSVFKKYEIKGIPVLVLIDRDGKVAKFWDGMQYEKDIRAALEAVLK
jgi:peroxiredoxin